MGAWAVGRATRSGEAVSRPNVTMDQTPEARRALLHWLKPGREWQIFAAVALHGSAYAASIAAWSRPIGTPWSNSRLAAVIALGVIQTAMSFWHGTRYAERRSRSITHDCDLVIERFNDLLGSLADNDVIVPGPNARIVVRDVEH